MRTRFAFAVTAALLAAVGVSSARAAGKPVEIKIGVEVGLRYDTLRFRVDPGAAVKVTFSNNDQMMHNMVIAQPGARLELVNASLLLGDDGPAMNYVPKSDKIIVHTNVLSPGDEQTLEFTAPKTEGVYPYVCTYPGHGFVMFGAMYVQKSDKLPPLDKDPNVPPPLPETPGGSPFLQVANAAKVVRDFMPNTGPASIAIGMPGGQSACWDAGVCRLRYVWSGGFIDIPYHKKDEAVLVGNVYYTTTPEEGLQIGDSAKRDVKFLGYTLVDSFPQFHYRVNGVEVSELILVRAGGPGITRRFEIAETDQPVRFVTNPKAGVTFTSTVGEFTDGVLTLTPKQAKSFAVSIVEPEHKVTPAAPAKGGAK
ncbi:MAG: hypothetical protein GC159_17850 [Phycisphaera sp.]|nr:hypothetical protein [Phycisphaera sp.]